MRELPGVNDIFELKSKFNPKLRETVDAARTMSPEDYMAYLNGAKSKEVIEERIEWVGLREQEEAKAGEEKEEEER